MDEAFCAVIMWSADTPQKRESFAPWSVQGVP